MKIIAIFFSLVLIVAFQNCGRSDFDVVDPVVGDSVAVLVPESPGVPSNGLTPQQEPDLSKCTIPTALPASAPAPLKIGIDVIVPGEIYVVYSGLDKSAVSQPYVAEETASIFLFRGKTIENSNLRQVLVFGAGYGNQNGAVKSIRLSQGLNHEAVNSAAFDVANVDYVIRNCFGMSVDRTEIQFIAPHGHVDHVNQEFFQELRNKGYPDTNLKIYVAAADKESLLDQYQNSGSDWDTFYEAKVVAIDPATLACKQSIYNFSVASGDIRVLGNPSHTSGTINLHHLTLNYMFLGAGPAGCDFSGSKYYFDAHKRMYLRTTPPAITASLSGKLQTQDHSEHVHDDGCF